MLERQLPESAVFVAHLDHDQQLWRLVDARGAGSFTAAPGMTLPADESLCFHMATDRAPRLCNDAAADPVYGRLAMRAHENIGSYLGIPLELSDGSRPGSLCAIAHEPGRYVSDDLELLALMARIVAYELERERRERDLAAVARVARELVAHAEPRSALCKAVIELSDAAFAVLWEPRPGGVLRLSAQAGVELPNVEQAIDGPGGTPEVFKSGQRLFLSDARGNPLARQRLVRAAGRIAALRTRGASRPGSGGRGGGLAPPAGRSDLTPGVDRLPAHHRGRGGHAAGRPRGRPAGVGGNRRAHRPRQPSGLEGDPPLRARPSGATRRTGVRGPRRPRRLQGVQRRPRPPGRRRPAQEGIHGLARSAAPRGLRLPLRRRRVRPAPAGHGPR